ncbi:MAG TPA: DNA alkylation repair protein [Ferruginibacter sp.]|jgi:3-methyladenine DNA glycosylase AlkC|nr:DNA alkylation repair protein [Ferruginibacter sp.]
MAALKDLYSPAFYDNFSNSLLATVPSFNKKEFIKKIFTKDFEHKELKARMKHTTEVLHDFLPKDYRKTVMIIQKTITELRKNNTEGRLEFIFFPDYIETYGIDDFDTSMKAIEFITQFVSCEFAVRPFIIKYGNKMIDQMKAWSLHKSEHVRRLASEGSRPRLPWAMALPALKKDPQSILPILNNLKNDPSEYVRRSVANNLNDIAKDNPAIVLQIAAKWKGKSKETDAIIKHGSRTLLKQGHTEILKHFGLDSKHISLSNFTITNPTIKIGDSLAFSFSIRNDSVKKQTVRIEYAVYYKRQKSLAGKKVFKISEKTYQPKEKITIQRKQKFTIITTRKFYIGDHQLSIIINGKEGKPQNFELID